MASNLSQSEVKEEGNLLIEAVTLLVQRQRETESWVAEQIWQAEERAAAADRSYAELESRLEGIEAHLARLLHDLEPGRGGPGDGERLARLREQLEGLKQSPGTAGHSARGGSTASMSSESPPTSVVEQHPTAGPAAIGRGPSVTFWDLLGSSPQDRFGLVLIGAGMIAVLYAILSQLRFS